MEKELLKKVLENVQKLQMLLYDTNSTIFVSKYRYYSVDFHVLYETFNGDYASHLVSFNKYNNLEEIRKKYYDFINLGCIHPYVWNHPEFFNI